MAHITGGEGDIRPSPSSLDALHCTALAACPACLVYLCWRVQRHGQFVYPPGRGSGMGQPKACALGFPGPASISSPGSLVAETIGAVTPNLGHSEGDCRLARPARYALLVDHRGCTERYHRPTPASGVQIRSCGRVTTEIALTSSEGQRENPGVSQASSRRTNRRQRDRGHSIGVTQPVSTTNSY